jgi:hypothetical protein
MGIVSDWPRRIKIAGRIFSRKKAQNSEKKKKAGKRSCDPANRVGWNFRELFRAFLRLNPTVKFLMAPSCHRF